MTQTQNGGEPSCAPSAGRTSSPSKTAPGAVGALVCGILALFIPVLGIILGIVAIVLAVSAGRAIARTPGAYTGNRLRIAGLVTGILGIVCWIVCWVAVRDKMIESVAEQTKATMNLVMVAINRYHDEKNDWPPDLKSLLTVDSCRELLSSGSHVMDSEGNVLDGFGRPIRYSKTGGLRGRPQLQSAGPDGKFGTQDDIFPMPGW